MTDIKHTLALYSIEEVTEYLLDRPDRFDSKRGQELLAGCILARWSVDKHQSVGVGFRICEKQKIESLDRPPLEQLIENFDLDDRDIDTLIGTDHWQSPIQITRLVATGKGSSPYDRLMNVIKKKLRVQPDHTITLAVLIDESFELAYNRLHKEVSSRVVPYGQIVLIGQMGPSPSLGRFQCIEIYPDVSISPEIIISLDK